jgi:hypothetical protein
MRCSGFMLVLAGCLSLSSAATTLAVTPAQRCEAGKLKAAGKDAACRANALAKTALGGTGDLAACDTKLSATYTKLQASGGCTSSLGADASIVTDFVDTASACTNEMLSGNFPVGCCTAQGGACLVDNDCCGTSPNGFIRGTPYFCNKTGGTPGFCDVLQ